MNISSSLLNSLLLYNPDTGQLFWKPRPAELFSSKRIWAGWNTKWAGKEAFTYTDKRGYKVGSLGGKTLKAHRVSWCMEFGQWPDEIDHQNHDRTDNRLENLREVSHIEQHKNMSKPSNNKSGVIGVHWHKGACLWIAAIGVKGRRITVLSTPDFDKAVEARRLAEIKYHFHSNHGK